MASSSIRVGCGSFTRKSSSSSSPATTRTAGRRVVTDGGRTSSSSAVAFANFVFATTTAASADDDDDEEDGDGDQAAAPILVVSDLDGTMVGDDAATAEFTAAWSSQGGSRLPPGSALVYSTGRSLESFAALIEEKAEVMATPDALICAVGTKVYRRRRHRQQTQPKPKGGSSTHDAYPSLDDDDDDDDDTWAAAAPPSDVDGWEEDPEWTARLDEGWDFNEVMTAAAAAIDAAGKDNAHFRPEEEFTSHKITLGVKDEYVEEVTASVRRSCETAGLTVKVIASGVGGWQYLDVVSDAAGKLESLEYVRGQFGVALDRTVACGDSGNDTLMLSGRNRAVVVGNAQPALMEWAEAEAEAAAAAAEAHEKDVDEEGVKQKDTVSLRQRQQRQQPGGRRRLYIAKEKEARGILEGLAEFGFLSGVTKQKT